MAKIEGFEQISKQLTALGAAASGKTLKTCSLGAMRLAFNAAKAAIPVADPPYHEGSGVRRGASGKVYATSGTVRTVDPYPKKTFLGRLVTPGFAQRSLRLRAFISRDKTLVTVALGVLAEAYYVLKYLELGTRFFPKRPWLEPSFRATSAAVGEKLGEKLRDRLDIAADRGEVDDSDDPEAAAEG